jgi:hypothetical protein
MEVAYKGISLAFVSEAIVCSMSILEVSHASDAVSR